MIKRRLGLLRLAARPCGLSYRGACNRNIDDAFELMREGLVYIHDTGRQKGQYKFKATDAGKAFLERINNEQ